MTSHPAIRRPAALLAGVLCLLFAVAAARDARAAPPGSPAALQPDPAARAAALAEEAWQLHERGRFADSIAKLNEAWSYLQAPALAWNLGRSHEAAGALAEAATWYRRCAELAPDETVRRRALDALGEVERRRREAAAQPEPAPIPEPTPGPDPTPEPEPQPPVPPRPRTALGPELDLTAGLGALVHDREVYRSSAALSLAAGWRLGRWRPELVVTTTLEPPAAVQLSPGLSVQLGIGWLRMALPALVYPTRAVGGRLGGGVAIPLSSDEFSRWALLAGADATWWFTDDAGDPLLSMTGLLGVRHAF